ncbi:DUF4265 domain-containing protein [Microbacterium sp. P03]|uniref:DUF4265 domain-containing protein n=1 Tax=Microbacterium sp. P03 TaxID=3366946 RepID=UPI003746A39B
MTDFREHPSLASIWDGTRLIPAPDALAADAQVWFVLPPDAEIEGAPIWEALNASKVAEDTFTVCGCPALFAQVAFGDTVRVASSDEGALVVTKVVARGGYRSARLWFEDGGESWRQPSETLAAEGCVVDVYSEKLVGISWRDSNDLTLALERLEAEGVLVYATA